ncbi:hypothetical protein CWI38_2232p0010 [Hamiltosporidium tvaerminnensis]|uniref:Uncharacterized protein n=1 Tax=Hamiltosporidium tvaerminnensis TaxID=1176355 RepID=A0A4Q9LKV0_9MICR|nr:hypothetical protein CWI38_2232p0010 [Hamiltosporidium tvaerminnensis]
MEKYLSKTIKGEYGNEISKLKDFFSLKNGHILVASMDIYLLTEVIKISLSNQQRYKKSIEENNYFDENIEFSNSYLVYYLDKKKSTSELYFLLEKSKTQDDFHLILTTISCMALENLDKRIKSRLNHNIIFLPVLPYKSVKQYVNEKAHKIDPRFSALLKNNLMQKYKINFDFESLFNILNSIHISLLIMILNCNIKNHKMIEQYRKFVFKHPELRNIKDKDISDALGDLLDLGFLDKKYNYVFSVDELKNYISKNRPFYLKRLLKN